MKKTLAFLLTLCMLLSFGSAVAEITYPIEEDVKVTVWIELDAGNSQVLTNYKDSLVFQRLQEATGVEIEFRHPTYGASAEDFSKMMADPKGMPDVIINFGNYYTGGTVAAYDDGVIYDLTPYLEAYAPAYYAAINASEEMKRQFYTEDGKVLSFDNIALEPDPMGESVIVRGDWCEEFGIDPTQLNTFAELEVYFQKILDNKPGVIPFISATSDNMLKMLFWSVNLVRDFYQVEGKVEYYANTDSYRQLLSTLNRWHEKGYLGTDYGVATGSQIRKQFSAGKIGMFFAPVGNAYSDAQTSGVAMDKAPYWQATEDMEMHTYDLGVNMGGGMKSVITTACDEEKIPAIMKLMNFSYTEEGARFANYGPEGLSWNYDENGNIKFTDWVLNNPDGHPTSIMHNVCRMNYWPRLRFAATTCNPNIVKDAVVTELRTRYTAIEGWDGQWIIPISAALNVEETAERADIMTDVDTYIGEMYYKFIRGDVDVDNDQAWEAYVNQLDKLNLGEAIEITQGAYDRYVSR